MVLLGDKAQVKAHFGPFRDSVNVTARSCIVCAERTVGIEIVWMHLMQLLDDKAQVEARFGLFGGGANLVAR
jgi:hypothetical protein